MHGRSRRSLEILAIEFVISWIEIFVAAPLFSYMLHLFFIVWNDEFEIQNDKLEIYSCDYQI